MLTNIFPNVQSPYIETVTDIPSVMDLIKSGHTKEKVCEGRLYGKGHPVFEKLKTETPTFSPNGCFTKKRTTENIQTLSGFIYLDVDGYDDPEIFRQQPFVYSYWKSFSGTGLGVLISVSGLTVENFKYSWTYLNDYFQQTGIDIDSHTKDVSRQCIISYDPDIYINPEPIPLIIPYPEVSISTNISSQMSPLKYYLTSTGSEKVRYKTVLDDYEGQDYIVIEDGKDCRNTYLPRKIFTGDRHKWMISFTNTMIFNNPSISYERLFIEVNRVNRDHCLQILTEKEIISIVKWTYDKYINQSLTIRTKKKKIWINPETKLSSKEKRIIICKESGKIRTHKTINDLVEIFTSLQKTDQKVTQKLLKIHSNKSIRTIKRHWKDVMDKVSFVNR